MGLWLCGGALPPPQPTTGSGERCKLTIGSWAEPQLPANLPSFCTFQVSNCEISVMKLCLVTSTRRRHCALKRLMHFRQMFAFTKSTQCQKVLSRNYTITPIPWNMISFYLSQMAATANTTRNRKHRRAAAKPAACAPNAVNTREQGKQGGRVR